MKFWQSLAFCEPDQCAAIARHAWVTRRLRREMLLADLEEDERAVPEDGSQPC